MMIKRGKISNRQLNNQGFSLLELLIVVAIISIMTFLTVISISVIGRGNAKKVNKNIYSCLSELKTSTMAKDGKWRMEVKKKDKEYVIEIYKDDNVMESYACSAARISMEYIIPDSAGDEDSSGATVYDIDDYTIKIKFSRSDGSCSSVVVADSNDPGDSGTRIDGKSSSGVFRVKGSGSAYKSKLWYKTGRVSIMN